MSIPAILLLAALLLVLCGNPIVGPRVYQDYDHGYRPSLVGVVLVIILVLILLGHPHGR